MLRPTESDVMKTPNLKPGHLPGVRDVVFAAVLLIVALLSGIYVDAGRPDTVRPSTWWQWALICLPPLLVAFRSINPAAVVVLATAAQTAVWVSGLPEVLLPVVVILYTAASESGTRGLRIAVAASTVLAAVTAVGVAVADDVTVYQVPLIVLTCGTAIVLGTSAAKQRTQAGVMAAAAAQADLLAVRRQDEAIADERAHIARELHDSVGHALSVIAVRAEAADRVADTKPAESRSAVSDIAVSARQALTDTRRVLAGLRTSSVAELTPPPDLDETRRMIDGLAASGVDVVVSSQGCADYPPSPAVAGGTHRVVQESITNAIKHGGPATRICVELRCTATALDASISNTTAGPATIDTAGGSGLAGMRERVAVLGGHFEAGPQPDNTFRVHVSLPNHDHRANQKPSP